MTSGTFGLFLEAAKNRLQIVCTYHGLEREVCPHAIGWGLRGEEMALVYQFAGRSVHGLPPMGEWRCLRLSEVRDANARAGDWHTGSRHSERQTCVKRVAFEVMA
jgi:hypothetical protein